VKLILLFIFLATQLFSFSQDLDSKSIKALKKEIKNTLKKQDQANLFYKLSLNYVGFYPDSVIYYGNKALHNFKNTSGHDEVIIDLNYQIGIAYIDLDLKKCKTYLNTSLKQAIEIQNDSLENLNYTALSAYFSRLPDIDSSTYYIVLATEYFKETNDSIALAYCYFNIMNNYNIVSNVNKTIEYGEMTLAITKSNNIEQLLGPVTIALAYTYYKTKDQKELANTYIKEAEKIALDTKNDELLLQVYLTKGINDYENSNYNSSISTYEKALKLSEVAKDSFYMGTCYFQLGLSNYKLQNNSQAKLYFDKTIRLKRSDIETIKKSYFYLAMLSSNSNTIDHNYYLSQYDSITSVENKLKTEELLVKFEASEKEKEIEVLKTKKAEDDLIIQKSKTRTIIIVATLILLVFLLILLIYRYISRQKILKQQIEFEKHKTEQSNLELKQKERELALKIDVLKNKNEVIDDLKNKIKESSKDEVYIETIVKSLEQNYVSDKHWDNIIHHFNTLHKNHVKDLEAKSDNITRNDIKLSILIKLGYTNSGMAEVLNISLEGVKKAKQRLKKKLE